MTSHPPWALVGDEVYAVADSKSPVLSPVYHHRTEYHVGYYDPTCTLVIRVETVEAETHKLCVVGYAVLNIFVDAKDVRKQPAESTHQVCRCSWAQCLFVDS